MAGFDLHLQFDRSQGIRGGVERALRAAIRSGTLAPGGRLPSSRALAADLGIARNTVAEVYTQLVQEGYLTGDRGGGTRVAMTAVPGVSRDRFSHLVSPTFDLRPGRPDVSAFPAVAWINAGRSVLNTMPVPALSYGDPRGPHQARAVIAAYLARVRGLHAGPERIVLCSGYRQIVSLVCRVIARRGAKTIAIETPGAPELADQARRAGLTAVPLPVDDDGALIGRLDAGAAILTPAHQYPSGVQLSAERRTRTLDWARRTGGLVLEDDYDGEFRYDRPPMACLQGLGPDVVAYAGSASKTLAPGLRLAWLVVPDHLIEEVVREKELTDRHCDNLSHLTLAAMIESGAYDRHIRAARLRYRRRRDELVATLANHQPSGIAAGLHVVLPLHEEEEPVLRRLAAKGVGTHGLRHFGEGFPPALVLGYGAPATHAWPQALEALAEGLVTPNRS